MILVPKFTWDHGVDEISNIWVREKRNGNQRLEIDRILLGRISVEAAKTPDDPRGAEQFHELLESLLRISKA